MRLNSRSAIITGSGQNIGKETAMLFAKEGARVVISGRDDKKGRGVRDEIRNAGGTAIYIHCDATIPEECANLISQTMKEYGRIDILVNNVGNGWGPRITDQSLEDWHKGIAVTLHSAFYCSKYALQHMMKNENGGAIVNIASIDGLLGEYGAPEYNAGKAGMINLTRSIALDYAQYNIRANAICPGQVEEHEGQSTQRDLLVRDLDEYVKKCVEPVPMKRKCKTIEVAYAALFLASDESSYITGTTLVIDGGLLAHTGLPGLKQFLK